MSTKKLFLSIFCVLFFLNLFAQSFDDIKSVQVEASVLSAPPSITLNWLTVDSPTSYNIYRKTAESNSWGTAIATLGATATSYTDTNVALNTLYYYRVLRTGAGGQGNGYIASGIEYVRDNHIGKILVVVDVSTIAINNTFLQQYLTDLQDEGWVPQVITVNATDSPVFVKNQIAAIYNADPVNVKSVILVGHVPVPYSGNINPDGHADHRGAWPADTYYADMNGTWTDTNVNNTVANDPRNDNVPGDGKFDQNTIVNAELAVGRVDFANMPAFSQTELQLLENYFQKNHDYRTMQFVPQYRALIENNFSTFSEGFGQNGQKNFPPLVSSANTSYIDFDNCKTSSYIWAYGCGSGTYTSAGGISTTADMATDNVQAIFTAIFGSYFGDWDRSDNFLRSALGSGTVLTNVWAGRPNFSFFPMGMGQTIGECVRISMSSPNAVYVSGNSARGVHMALMGDPTLTMYINNCTAPTSVSAAQVSNGVSVTWANASNACDGYFVYYKKTSEDIYNRFNDSPITSNNLLVNTLCENESYDFMVRSAKLTLTPSGTFYKIGPGTSFSSITVTNNFMNMYADADCITIHPCPTNNYYAIKGLFANYTVEILDANETLYQTLTSNNEWINIDLNALPAGTFFVRIRHNTFSEVQVQRLLKT